MAFVIFMALAYFYTYRAQKPLREALAKQKQFVSDASHEIRTPLALMKTEAEVLLRDRHATEKDYEIFAQNVVQDIDTLNALTTRLLSLASLESKKEPLRNPLDLFPLLESVITVFEARAQEK
jgi:signal transduction histidine kinase